MQSTANNAHLTKLLNNPATPDGASGLLLQLVYTRLSAFSSTGNHQQL